MKRYRFLCLILILVLLSAAGSRALGSPEETQQEITELEKTVDALQKEIESREKRINEINRELKESETRYQKTTAELEAAQSQFDKKNLLFGERVRSAYMKGGLSYVEVLLNAESFGDLIARIVYLSRILGRDAAIVSALRDEYAVYQERKTAMEQERNILEDLRFQLEAENKNLMVEKQAKDNLLAASKDKLAEELARIPQAEKKPVYGVVLDNHAGARPQYGLDQADVIYEYEVEGRITRYLALYAEFPTKVGPVRSARQHNIILGLENDIHFIHAGGSQDNIALIKSLSKLRSTDALTSRSKQFYRDSSRRAPHNLYVNLQEINLEPPSESVAVRPGYLSREGQATPSLSIKYSNTYTISFTYVPDEGYYRRYINNRQHLDGNGKAIHARNIIVQYTPFYNDSRSRPTADLIGEGPIEFYSQGQYFRGIWRKNSESEPTRFYYQDGQEIERVYGQTWIQIVRD